MLPLHSRIVELGYNREATRPRKRKQRSKTRKESKTKLEVKTSVKESNGAIQSLVVGFPE